MGISAVGLPVDNLCARSGGEGLAPAMAAWARERKLDALLVMTGFQDAAGQFRRQLVLSDAGTPRPAAAKLATHLKEPLKLESVPVAGEGAEAIVAFEQKELKSSRKQVAPLVASYYESQGVAKM